MGVCGFREAPKCLNYDEGDWVISMIKKILIHNFLIFAKRFYTVSIIKIINMKKFLFILLLSCPVLLSAQVSREIPYTQDDRDRMIRLETDVSNLRSEMKSNIDILRSDMKSNIADIRLDIRWSFGILFSMMAVLVGFVLWDRRSVVAPVQREQAEQKQNYETLLKALRQLAEKQADLREVLKNSGLL